MALNGLAHQVSKVMENEADSRRKVFSEVRQEEKMGRDEFPWPARIREF